MRYITKNLKKQIKDRICDQFIYFDNDWNWDCSFDDEDQVLYVRFIFYIDGVGHSINRIIGYDEIRTAVTWQIIIDYHCRSILLAADEIKDGKDEN